ncbi:MAG: hypothetical protein ACRC4W_00140 [Treponemataceae bacterium]
MRCFINRGLILEHCIRDAIHKYFDDIKLEELYKNFHVSVTNDHPFAELYKHDSLTAADYFPSVIITTEEDSKPRDLMDLSPNIDCIGINIDDLNEITKTTKKVGDEEIELSGICNVIEKSILDYLKKELEDKGMVYGYSCTTRKKDTISIEIWAENIQLKNELYEQLRLFIVSNLENFLEVDYGFYAIDVIETSLVGHRSNNYNIDFDVALTGGHISFDVNYCIEQIVIDTDIKELHGEIITEVIDRVKTEKNKR